MEIHGNNSSLFIDPQATTGSGYFEVQILSLTNNRGTLVDGRCCGGGTDGDTDRRNGGGFPPCTEPCTTAFWLCLKEYQSNVTAIGSCSFGNVSSHALGQNTFTLNDPVTLQLHFTFRWTVSQRNFKNNKKNFLHNNKKGEKVRENIYFHCSKRRMHRGS